MKIASLLLAATLASAGVVSADTPAHGARTYEVTITNITPGQTFTPILAVTHKASIGLFELGEPASHELATLAESGNVMPLSEQLHAMPGKVLDQDIGAGLLGPGESVTLTVEGNRRFNRLGNNPDDMLREIKESFPQIWIHGFSPSEIKHFGKVSRVDTRTVIQRLRSGPSRLDAGPPT